MADALTNRILVDTPTTTVVHLTNISDGTGEAAATKVVKANLVQCEVGSARAAPVSLDIGAVRWNIQGFTNVRILWDHTTDDLALALAGSGYEDFIGPGTSRGGGQGAVLADPRSAGGLGDILLTTIGANASATYDITLWLMKAAT